MEEDGPETTFVIIPSKPSHRPSLKRTTPKLRFLYALLNSIKKCRCKKKRTNHFDIESQLKEKTE